MASNSRTSWSVSSPEERNGSPERTHSRKCRASSRYDQTRGLTLPGCPVDLYARRGLLLHQRGRLRPQPAALKVELGMLVPGMVAGVSALDHRAHPADIEHNQPGHSVVIQVRGYYRRLAGGISQQEAQQIEIVGPLLQETKIGIVPFLGKPVGAVVRSGRCGLLRTLEGNVGVLPIEPIAPKAVIARQQKAPTFARLPPGGQGGEIGNVEILGYEAAAHKAEPDRTRHHRCLLMKQALERLSLAPPFPLEAQGTVGTHTRPPASIRSRWNPGKQRSPVPAPTNRASRSPGGGRSQ